MASRLLLQDSVSGQTEVRLTVFDDVVKCEAGELSRMITVGWFKDEVSALGAVLERELMRSAILPEMRKLPSLAVRCEYRHGISGHPVERFHRGTASKMSSLGRRVVLLPGANGKCWLQV